MAVNSGARDPQPSGYEEVDAGEYRRELLAEGIGEDEAPGLLAILDLLCDDRSDYLPTGVQNVLGREPRDFAAYVADAAATGAWREPTAA